MTVEETVALILRNVESLRKTLGMSELFVVKDVMDTCRGTRTGGE